jgi:hypothetical protein
MRSASPSRLSASAAWDYVANALQGLGRATNCIFTQNPREALLPPCDEGEEDGDA